MKIFTNFIVFIFVTSLNSTSFAQSDFECLEPLVKMGFSITDAINPDSRLTEEYRHRYIIGDFNTVEYINGRLQCRGIREVSPLLNRIDELHDVRNKAFFDRIVGGAPAAIVKPDIVKFRGRDYCIGQRMSVCKIVKKTSRFRRELSYEVKLIARFITAAAKASTSLDRNRYSPINRITLRFWDPKRSYTQDIKNHDNYMGGSQGSKVARFKNRISMPNFLAFQDAGGYPYEPKNGIHEKTIAVGQAYKDFMGSPVSLGCVRMEPYASRFLRWYLPVHARFFVTYDETRVRNTVP